MRAGTLLILRTAADSCGRTACSRPRCREAAQVGPGTPACLMMEPGGGPPRRAPVLGVDIQAGVTCPRKAGPTWPARCWVPSTCLRDRVSRMEVPGLREPMGRPHTRWVSNLGTRRGGLGRAWEGLLQIRWLYLFSGTSVLCAVLRSDSRGALSPGCGVGPAASAALWMGCSCSVFSAFCPHADVGPSRHRCALAGLWPWPLCWEGSDPRSRRALLAPQHLGGAFLPGGTLTSGQLAARVQSPERQGLRPVSCGGRAGAGTPHGAGTRALRLGLCAREEGGWCVGVLLTALQTHMCAPRTCALTPACTRAHVPARPTPSAGCRQFLSPVSHLESRSVFDGPFALF